MLAIFSFRGRSGCFSDAAYYTRWLTSPLPSWTTFLLFETTLVSSDLQILGWCLWTRSSSQVPRAWSFRFLSSRGFLEDFFTVERSDEVVLWLVDDVGDRKELEHGLASSWKRGEKTVCQKDLVNGVFWMFVPSKTILGPTKVLWTTIHYFD